MGRIDSSPLKNSRDNAAISDHFTAMNLPRLLTRMRSLRGVVLFALGMVAPSFSADVEDYLAGSWVMEDGSPSLLYPANTDKFNVLRVSPGQSTWADGYFFLKWANAARPERGYYSTETGRVWITTYRFVNQKEQRVEYRGIFELNENGAVVWRGTATKTSARKVTWKFEAKKG